MNGLVLTLTFNAVQFLIITSNIDIRKTIHSDTARLHSLRFYTPKSHVKSPRDACSCIR